MRSIDRDARTVLTLAQARARSLHAVALGTAHIAWALENAGTDPEALLLAEPTQAPDRLEPSPEMLPFSRELETLFIGSRDVPVRVVDLLELTQAP